MSDIRYEAKIDWTIKMLGVDDFERIECWTVTRIENNYIRTIAKYDTQEAALTVVDFLTDASRAELA